MTSSMISEIRRLHSGEARSYRELRLLALRLHPDAFGSSFAEEACLEDGVFAERLAKGTVFGVWSGEQLVASAGLALRVKIKLRHKSVLWGMFVRPEVRGCGVGKCLLSAVLAHARTCCEEVLLTVVEGNEAAHRLYASAGFVEYGREPRAIKVGTEYYQELMMRLPIEC